MKKSFILGIMVGGIIFGTSVFAISNYLYKANEVSYTPGDSSWNVGNVKEAIDNLKSTSGTALTDLKNTNIAKAVSANGSSLSSVINTLGGISNKGNLTKTINPGESVSITAGYYSSGKITANANQNSGTYNVTSNGTKDMGVNNSYRYINVNVGEAATLLWQNNAYTSNFEGQNAYLNQSIRNFRTIRVVSYSPNANNWCYNDYPVSIFVGSGYGNSIRQATAGPMKLANANSDTIVIRPMWYINDTTIYFNFCLFINISHSAVAITNNEMVPYQIYGIN